MKVRIYITVILLLLIIAHPLFSDLGGNRSLKLKGRILDKKGRKIKYARVVATMIPSQGNNAFQDTKKNKNLSKKRYVTYSNQFGNWQLEIPHAESIFIKVFSNIYKTVQKILTFDKTKIKSTQITFRLDDGLIEILWGSFEFFQLYVPPLHQKNLETLITDNPGQAVDDYINSRIKSSMRNQAHAFAGYILFQNSKYPESKKQFESAGSKLWFNLMGNLRKNGDQYQESLFYYLKGTTTKERADGLFYLANKFAEQGDSQNEKICYQTALTDYQKLLRSLKYRWNEEHIEKSNFCIGKLKEKFGFFEKKPSVKRELADILKKAGDYCKKLDGIAIYYFCNELKKDKVVLLRKLAKAMEKPEEFFENFSPLKIRRSRIIDIYKYDIQFIKKKNGVITEDRKLLMERLDNSNPGIPILSYSIKEPLYGPHTLIAFGWQNLFDYHKIGDEKIFGEDTVVIEATPRWHSVFNKMSGKIWIDEKDGSVLKIEWNYARVQNRNQLRKMGLILDREPDLKFISEFGIKKNGLRFPSRCYIVESYVNKSNQRFIRLKVDIEYMNYQFFIVSSEVEVHDEY